MILLIHECHPKMHYLNNVHFIKGVIRGLNICHGIRKSRIISQFNVPTTISPFVSAHRLRGADRSVAILEIRECRFVVSLIRASSRVDGRYRWSKPHVHKNEEMIKTT